MSSLIFLPILAVVFYLLLIRPQQRRASQQKRLLSSLSVGEEVVTAGGVFGTVTALDSERMWLEVAPGVTIVFLRQALARRLSDVDRSGGGVDGAGVDEDDMVSEWHSETGQEGLPSLPGEPTAEARAAAPEGPGQEAAAEGLGQEAAAEGPGQQAHQAWPEAREVPEPPSGPPGAGDGASPGTPPEPEVAGGGGDGAFPGVAEPPTATTGDRAAGERTEHPGASEEGGAQAPPGAVKPPASDA